MHSCYDAYLVYGVMDNSDRLIDSDWLEEHFPEMGRYASDIVRNYMCTPVYGYTCSGDEINGVYQIAMSDESKAEIKKLYDMICDYNKAIGETNMPAIGYYSVISGDYKTEQYTFIPEPETDSADEDVSESESESQLLEHSQQRMPSAALDLDEDMHLIQQQYGIGNPQEESDCDSDAT